MASLGALCLKGQHADPHMGQAASLVRLSPKRHHPALWPQRRCSLPARSSKSSSASVARGCPDPWPPAIRACWNCTFAATISSSTSAAATGPTFPASISWCSTLTSANLSAARSQGYLSTYCILRGGAPAMERSSAAVVMAETERSTVRPRPLQRRLLALDMIRL